MSEIPYIFETPIPSFFRENGWFKSDNALKFITWAFSRCSIYEHEICHDNQRIILKPFQFIFGRRICSTETNMSEMEVRTQQISMEKAGYLKKAPNKTPNRFTIYEWVTGAFLNSDNQQNNQKTTNKQPTSNHKLERNNVIVSFVKDVRGCGNVHNSSIEENSSFSQGAFSLDSLSSFDAHMEFISTFRFLNGLGVNEKVQARWLIKYPIHEISASLQYLVKMRNKKAIPKEEAYVEKCLTLRWWETNKMREEATKREKQYEKERKARAKEYE